MDFAKLIRYAYYIDEVEGNRKMEDDQSALIVRGVLSLARRLRAARPPGSISLASISILSTLWRLGPMPAVKLAAEEGLQPQSLTRLIQGLEDAGLISRTPGETDRRELVISVTPSGLEALLTDLRARRDWLTQAMAASLSEKETRILFEAAEAMVKLAGYDVGQSPSQRSFGPVGGNVHELATRNERGATK